MSPERLKEALRAAVAEADVPGATIVLGYGLCSNSVLGLKTEHATLVVPRVDDCIAMLLGSNEAFSAESEKERGSYYVAKAYLEECDTIMSEHEKLVEKRGRERAEMMMRLLLKHYTRIVLVDTGRYDLQPYRARVAEFAETFDLAVEEVPGHDADPRCARGRRLGRRLRRRPSRPRAHPPGLPAGAVRRRGRRRRRRQRPVRGRPAGVNVLCIAGFLGSGKTTVLLEVARAMSARGAQLAIIENEIGEVGVDGGYVREQGLPVQELFGGCICCTLQVGLVETLRAVETRYEPDWVIIEPTGLAAPGDILGLVVDNCPHVDTIRVLTLVDAPRWPMLLEIVEPLVTAQLEAADIVAVNKVDQVDEKALEAVMDSVRALAGKATVLPVSATSGAGMKRLLGAVV